MYFYVLLDPQTSLPQQVARQQYVLIHRPHGQGRRGRRRLHRPRELSDGGRQTSSLGASECCEGGREQSMGRPEVVVN